MNKYQKETELQLLQNEANALHKLEKTYTRALADVKREIRTLQHDIDELIAGGAENPTQIRAKQYQLKYRQALEKQIDSIMDVLKDGSVKTVDEYLRKMYEDGYLSQIYNLHMQDVPVMVPVNQDMLMKAITKDIGGMKFSERLYADVDRVKRAVMDEISRGITTGMPYIDVARNVANRIGVGMRKAYTIARTEGGRVATEAKLDSMAAAKEKGADIVKVWDATLDKKTRPVHRELDGKHVELDEDFEYTRGGGGTVSAPHHFGKAALDVNCRCALLSVPRWDIDDEYTKRDNITGKLIQAKNYKDWAKKYHEEIYEEEKRLDALAQQAGKQKAKDILSAAAATEPKKAISWKDAPAGRIFSSKKDALDYFEQQHGIPIKDGKRYKLDDNIAIGMAEWQDKFTSFFSEFNAANPVKIPQISIKPPSQMRGGRVLGYYQHYKNFPAAVELAMEGSYHMNLDRARQLQIGTYERGWQSGKNPLHTYIHEYGHHVSDAMRWITENPGWENEFINSCVEDYKKLHPEYTARSYIRLGKELSQYGVTSASECFAEAFAEYFGEENPRDFARIFGEKLERLLKEV